MTWTRTRIPRGRIRRWAGTLLEVTLEYDGATLRQAAQPGQAGAAQHCALAVDCRRHRLVGARPGPHVDPRSHDLGPPPQPLTPQGRLELAYGGAAVLLGGVGPRRRGRRHGER